MQIGDVNKLTKRTKELLPDLRSYGRMLLVEPRNHVLRGVCVENSSDRTAGYVWAFVFLLSCPPPFFLGFNLGMRLGGGSRTWRVENGDELAQKVMTEGVDFWTQASNPREFTRWRKVAMSQDLHILKSRGLAHVLCREWDEAALAFKELKARAEPYVDTEWVAELRDVAVNLRERLSREPESVYSQAIAWEYDNARSLKLEPEPPFAG